ncbi:unnamed protein product [Mytilus edulis]|uniref:TIR domain-containing protein n=1 Tax=Mytilus edulis TaxID=6550 RepID=A0A8S3TY00_MYTED|nr:unnamed protein product [Mytilus edulis]
MIQSDTLILNRYGRALWNLSEHRVGNDKIDFLYQAERLLSNSIRESSLNWFGYTTRMLVRKDIGLFYYGNDKPKAKSYLKLAVEDGYQCFISKGTPKAICQLVEICQFLGKFPDIWKYGFKYVKENEKCYLLDALDYLNFGLQQGGPTDYFLAYHMGIILFDLDEIKSAVDWMKRAVSLSNTKSNMALKLACQYMIKRYINEVDEKPNVVYLLKEFVFTMMKGKEKYGKIEDVYTFLFKREKKGFYERCIADRDFEPGKFIFENIENSFRKSSKILLVITNNFVSSYWCQFETNQALLESMESRKDCIIPLYLEECDIPDKLKHITYADFTNDDDYIFEIMKLKRALLPE